MLSSPFFFDFLSPVLPLPVRTPVPLPRVSPRRLCPQRLLIESGLIRMMCHGDNAAVAPPVKHRVPPPLIIDRAEAPLAGVYKGRKHYADRRRRVFHRTTPRRAQAKGKVKRFEADGHYPQSPQRVFSEVTQLAFPWTAQHGMRRELMSRVVG